MASNYQMWMTGNGEVEKMRFPVLPESYQIKQGSNNLSINVAGVGEVTIMQDSPAAVVSFSSFFPGTEFQGVKAFKKPKTYVSKMEQWKNSDKPVHFLITGTRINFYCTIEDFQYEEAGGDVGTYYYSLTLKEYREVKVRQITVDASGNATVPGNNTTRTDNRQTPKTYTIKYGDCLWNLAKEYLGSGSKYTEIFELNRDILTDPNIIYPGQVIRLTA